MYKQPTFWLLVSLTLALSLVTRNILLSQDELFHYGKDLPEIMHLVDQAYVDEVQFQKLLPGLYQGALEKVDENASYIPPGVTTKDASEELLKQTGLVLRKHNGYCYVLSVMPGSPAAAAGFIADTYIRDINGESTRHKSLHQLRSRIAETKEPLQITLIGEPILNEKSVSLAPDRFKLPEISHQLLEQNFHVVSFPAFYRGWKRDLKRTIDKGLKQPPTKLVLDLRGNGSGSSDDMRDLASLFLPQGSIGQWIDREGQATDILNPNAGPFANQHLYILVNKSTSGAAEHFSAVLQTFDQATVIGVATFGFPMLYEDLPLKSGGTLRLATRKWQLTNGEAFTFEGIEPRLAVTLDKQQKLAADKDEDAFLKAALAALKDYEITKTLQKAG